MEDKKMDVDIIGGGIVGLSTAYHILKKYNHQNTSGKLISLAVVEKESRIAQHQTGHNSGVIHSGLYYQPGSLKAKNCIEGYGLLLDFCEKEDVAFEVCGKIVVATNQDEVTRLRMLQERGVQNGLENIKWIEGDEIVNYEPHISGLAALHVPQTGIVNYREVCERLAGYITKWGGEIFTNTPVVDITGDSLSQIIVSGAVSFRAKVVVNCAGLHSDVVAKMTTPIDSQIIPFRGEYYKLKAEKKHLINHLVYPVPDPSFPFLGVHFTRLINGDVEAGPNAVLAYSREGYTNKDFVARELYETVAFSGFRQLAQKYWKTGLAEFYRSYSKRAFTKALQKLMPSIQSSDLEVAPAGVRAQACTKAGQLIDDFHIIEDKRMIQVLNTPSPAATSSLAIGQHIARLLDVHL